MRTKFGAFRQKCTIDPISGGMPPDYNQTSEKVLPFAKVRSIFGQTPEWSIATMRQSRGHTLFKIPVKPLSNSRLSSLALSGSPLPRCLVSLARISVGRSSRGLMVPCSMSWMMSTQHSFSWLHATSKNPMKPMLITPTSSSRRPNKNWI